MNLHGQVGFFPAAYVEAFVQNQPMFTQVT
jgi:hypothetical protein